jgi:two-component system LytT family response regulator
MQIEHGVLSYTKSEKEVRLVLRAITVDDEFHNHLIFKKMIEETGQIKVVAQFIDYRKVLEQIGDIKPDVVFMDIEMPGMNGLELAECLSVMDKDLQIVFVTAYRQYAIEAFRVNAIDYLLKPIDPYEINRVVNKLRESTKINAPFSIDLEAVTNNQYMIRCLGEFEVYGNESKRMVHWLTSKVEELFAYFLVNQKKCINKCEICDALWPDADPDKSLTSLYTSVHRLRKTFEVEGVPLQIKTCHNGYRIEMESCTTDLQEFEKLVQCLNKDNTFVNIESELKNLILAEQYYRGELYANQSYLWNAPLQEAVNLKYKNLCFQLVAYFIDNKEFQQAEYFLEKLLKYFPDDEKACILLMDIFDNQKNKVAIERQYQKYNAYLQNELGVVVSPKMQRHFISILKEYK